MSAPIARVNLRANGWIEDAEDGEYVRYVDHEAALDAERQTIEGILAAAFARHPESSREAWQDTLRRVSKREYERGLNEGRAGD